MCIYNVNESVIIIFIISFSFQEGNSSHETQPLLANAWLYIIGLPYVFEEEKRLL